MMLDTDEIVNPRSPENLEDRKERTQGQMSRSEFAATLLKLKDLPDRFVIHELTCLANELAPLANYVIDAINDRFAEVECTWTNRITLWFKHELR